MQVREHLGSFTPLHPFDPLEHGQYAQEENIILEANNFPTFTFRYDPYFYYLHGPVRS